MSDSFYYLAYGSNLLPSRLKARTPSARPLGSVSIAGKRLAWHKIGVDDSGKCDMMDGIEDDLIYGVIYRIAAEDLGALDEAEDLDVGYRAIELSLELDGESITARSYKAIVTDPALKPFRWYKQLVIAGARHFSLPQSYINGLEAVEAWADSNRGRAARHQALLNKNG